MITVTDSQGCVSWIDFFFSSGTFCIFSGRLLYEMRCTHITRWLWPRGHSGGSGSWKKHCPFQGSQPGASRWSSRLYQSARTCSWCMKSFSEAHSMRCDRCTRTEMKDLCSTPDLILQQSRELVVSSVSGRWVGIFPCMAPAGITVAECLQESQLCAHWGFMITKHQASGGRRSCSLESDSGQHCRMS